MMRKIGSLLVFGAAVFACSTAMADIVQYHFDFTAADMLNMQFADGLAGQSAAEVGLFNGAHLLRDKTSSGGVAARTYVAAQHNNFIDRWNSYVNAGYELEYFNLWGLDGRGAGWGEDYKPQEWLSQASPSGWSSWTTTWTDAGWGTPPAGFNTEEIVGWATDNGGIDLIRLNTDGTWDINGTSYGTVEAYQSYLESIEFSFDLLFDTDDMFWGGTTYGAPNSIPGEITLWWGGWLDAASGYDSATSQLMDSNMVLRGTVVPEPATMSLLGLGVGGLVLSRIRRKRS